MRGRAIANTSTSWPRPRPNHGPHFPARRLPRRLECAAPQLGLKAQRGRPMLGQLPPHPVPVCASQGATYTSWCSAGWTCLLIPKGCGPRARRASWPHSRSCLYPAPLDRLRTAAPWAPYPPLLLLCGFRQGTRQSAAPLAVQILCLAWHYRTHVADLGPDVLAHGACSLNWGRSWAPFESTCGVRQGDPHFPLALWHVH